MKLNDFNRGAINSKSNYYQIVILDLKEYFCSGVGARESLSGGAAWRIPSSRFSGLCRASPGDCRPGKTYHVTSCCLHNGGPRLDTETASKTGHVNRGDCTASRFTSTGCNLNIPKINLRRKEKGEHGWKRPEW